MANLTPEQRAAQRKLVGVLNAKYAMWFEPNGEFCIWRDGVADGIPELSEAYDALEIPYSVRAEEIVVRRRKTAGFTITVAWDDLSALTRWVPSFQKSIDSVRTEVEKARTTDTAQ
ncbi:hypothetical protein [Leifsonia sp. P73]|uniref:hypothetical protein n=1 Tax=Leifsonia sp. P73 TaxID=3423959 RepID=UPI003DA4D2E4